jgi:hypothetical protein
MVDARWHPVQTPPPDRAPLADATPAGFVPGSVPYAARVGVDTQCSDLPGGIGTPVNYTGPGGGKNPCGTFECCMEFCDARPECGVFMFGSVADLTDACWCAG